MVRAKKRKILILGANGMLGSQLTMAFAQDNFIAWTKHELDITKQKEVKKKITDLKPDIVINAAAFTAVDECEKKADLALAVNGEAVGYIALACRELDCPLVHYSTDYVFSGHKRLGYKEDDKTNPINTYGKSKEYGEKLLKKYCPKYYLIRSSWLYGPNGHNFVDTVAEIAPERPELKMVNDQNGKPTYTKDLAQRTKELLDKGHDYGIYHITNEGMTTWFKLAKEICRYLRIKTKITPITSYQLPRPAKRPHYSALLNTKIKKSRHWQKALTDYLATKK